MYIWKFQIRLYIYDVINFCVVIVEYCSLLSLLLNSIWGKYNKLVYHLSSNVIECIPEAYYTLVLFIYSYFKS